MDIEHLAVVGLEQPPDLTLELERRALESLQLLAGDLVEVLGVLSGGGGALFDEGDLVVGEAVEVVDEAIEPTKLVLLLPL